MTFSVGIDATVHDSQRICTGASTEEASLTALLLCYLVVLPHRVQVELDGVRVWATNSVMPKIPASLLDNGEVRIPHRSENDGGVGLLVVMAVSKAKITLLKKSFWEKYGDDLVKSLKANLSAYLEKVIVITMCGDVAEVDTSIHTSSEAAADADTMYKASEGIQRVVSGEYCRLLTAILDAADAELRAT
ncbi:serine/threonine protein kinase [Phytophthora cinnamomi]|uniref:serine/threonine protein kinase n=1 Tax=Phytophthora cinnamomi TaxID=4785 RepID=UPI00355A973A|nr:serine/threonine protein kinase [Phytophthora cinnamomi]